MYFHSLYSSKIKYIAYIIIFEEETIIDVYVTNHSDKIICNRLCYKAKNVAFINIKIDFLLHKSKDI